MLLQQRNQPQSQDTCTIAGRSCCWGNPGQNQSRSTYHLPGQNQISGGEHSSSSQASVDRSLAHHAVVHDARGNVRAGVEVGAVRVLGLVRHLLVALGQGRVVRVRAVLGTLFSSMDIEFRTGRGARNGGGDQQGA